MRCVFTGMRSYPARTLTFSRSRPCGPGRSGPTSLPASGSRSLGSHRDRLVDVAAPPPLGGEHAPDDQPIAGPAREVLVPRAHELRLVVEAPARQFLGCEHVAQLAGAVLHPRDVRIGEADLRAPHAVLLGHAALHGVAIHRAVPSALD